MEFNLLGLHAKGGGSFGPNVKKPTSWVKGGGVVQIPGPLPQAESKVYSRISNMCVLFFLSHSGVYLYIKYVRYNPFGGWVYVAGGLILHYHFLSGPYPKCLQC